MSFNWIQACKDCKRKDIALGCTHSPPLDVQARLRMEEELAAQQLDDEDEIAEYHEAICEARAVAQQNARQFALQLDPATPCDFTVERSDDGKTLTYSVQCGDVVLARVNRPAPRRRGRLSRSKGTTTNPATTTRTKTSDEPTTTASSTVPKEERTIPTLNLTADDLNGAPTKPSQPSKRVKRLDQISIAPLPTGVPHYAFMMVHDQPDTTVNSYIGFSVYPQEAVRQHNSPVFKSRMTTTHAPHWYLDRAIGPFPSAKVAMECATKWATQTRGVASKRIKAVILAHEVYNVDVYARDAPALQQSPPPGPEYKVEKIERGYFHITPTWQPRVSQEERRVNNPLDVTGRINVEYVKTPLVKIKMPPVAPELEARTPQPYNNVCINMASPRTEWNGQYREWKAFDAHRRRDARLDRMVEDLLAHPIHVPLVREVHTNLQFHERYHAHRRTHQSAAVGPKVGIMASGAGMGDKRDADIARLKERLVDVGEKLVRFNTAHAFTIQALQTEQARLSRRFADMVVAKEEARRAYEAQLEERDKKIAQLELKHEMANFLSRADTAVAVCQENEKHKKRVRELQELCDAQMLELVALRESEETQSLALQQLTERNALLEEHYVDANAMIERLKAVLQSMSLSSSLSSS